MIDGSKKCNRQLAFELQNSHFCEKCSKIKQHTLITLNKSRFYIACSDVLVQTSLQIIYTYWMKLSKILLFVSGE